MRVIAGEFRSRILNAPSGLSTRPTSDRLRETLFNVLAPSMEDTRFLDLYAGSGAVGIEALSRGSSQVVFVEKAVPAIKILRGNLDSLGLVAHFQIHSGSVADYFRRAPLGQLTKFDIVFLDPPYDAVDEYSNTLQQLGSTVQRFLAPGARVIAEHRRQQKLDDQYGSLHHTRLLQQGDAALSFFMQHPVDEEK